jgi:hypothetical protein
MATVTFHHQLELARRFRSDHHDPVYDQLRFAFKQLARTIAFLDEQITEARASTPTGGVPSTGGPGAV